MPTTRATRDLCSMVSRFERAAVGACIVVIVALTATSCFDAPSSVFARLIEARRLTADLLVRFTKAADAANRAVMADTDEDSVAFAREADEDAHAVASELDKLAGIVRALEYADELKLLAEFREAFSKYRKLDTEILVLAVENTNLKAQRLCFGPGREAADALRDALAPITRAAAPKDLWQARALTETAVLGVREIQALQPPHIAASEDPAMNELEKQMASSETKTRAALQELASLDGAELKPAIDAANAALSRFMGINAQIVVLSRRNSNVRSLALSLGQKRTLTAACETSLRALSDRLEKRSFSATR